MLCLEGRCAYCEVGELGFWRCNDGVTIIVMCDECDSAWFDPEHRALADAVMPGASMAIPGTNLVVGGKLARWATREEVERAGWAAHIDHERPAPGDRSPFA